MGYRKITIGTQTYIKYMGVRHIGKTHFLKTETYMGSTGQNGQFGIEFRVLAWI